MNCPRCGNPAAARKRVCDVCGCDLTVYRRIVRLSNGYYNKGLEKAKVRDLTGAAAVLNKSLEMNKKNTAARNLLGLVLFEMGEVVAALSEWVISKHFQPEDNEADYFMEKVQNNPTKLDAVNQAVKKYNIALDAARQGNDDLAILQLKKVISLQSNFIRALQLLALMYLKNGDYERAKRQIQRITRIDVANTKALKYQGEINRMTAGNTPGEIPFWSDGAQVLEGSESGRALMPVNSYKEDKPNVMVFVNLLLGVLIGIAVVYYLIVPTIEDNIKEEYNSQKVDYSAELSSKSATITQQEKTIASLTNRLDDTEKALLEAESKPAEITVSAESYEDFFAAWKAYSELKAKEYSDEELQALALSLWAINTENYGADAVSILKGMRDDIYPLAARKIYKVGKEQYDSGDYENAVSMLRAAVDFNPESDTAMYYLGKAYQAVENFEDAVYYYKLMLEICPNSTLKQYIPQRLRECGVDEE